MPRLPNLSRTIKKTDILGLIEELSQLPPLAEEERCLTRLEALEMLKEPVKKLFQEGRIIKDIVAIINDKQCFISLKNQDVRNLITDKKFKNTSKKRVPKNIVENQQSQGGEEDSAISFTDADLMPKIISTIPENVEAKPGTFTLTPDDPDL